MSLLSSEPLPPTLEHKALLSILDDSLAIAEFSPDGTLLSANGLYLKLFGYSPAQLCGLHHRMLYASSLSDVSACDRLWGSLRNGQAISGQYPYMSADGRQLWLAATYKAVFTADGRVAKVVQFATDVTARVEQEHLEHERTRLISLFAEHSHNALVLADHKGCVLFANDAVYQLFGYTPQELLGKPLMQLFNRLQAQITPLSEVLEHLDTGNSYSSEELLYSKHKQPLLCALRVNPIVDKHGVFSHVVCVVNDLTDAKIHEVLQRKALESMAGEAPLAEVMTLICNEVERIAPEVVASILRVDEHRMLRPLASPSLPQSYARALDGVVIGPDVGSCGTAAFIGAPVHVRDIENDPLWAPYKHLPLPLGLRACWSTPIKTSAGQVIGTFAFYYREVRDPSEFHKRLVQICTHLCALALERDSARLKIRQLAFYDSLTGLPNRNLLLANADQAIASAERNHQSLAVLFIDLDRFKQVNDSFGHPAGDDLLCLIAERLRSDAYNSEIIGRWSGDEFVIVLNPCTAAQAVDTVERLQALISMPCDIGGITLMPSASIGISQYPDDGQDMETLLHCADLAMYQAKTHGRGRFSFFSNDMNQLAQERLTLEIALRNALQGQRLQLHYQPLVNLKTGALLGVEALARWHDPVFGHVSPTRFIPLAEESGLIGALSDWALTQSCRQLAQWRREGLVVPGVSVNLSATNFHNRDLPRQIIDTLKQYALQPHDLTLEITESVMLDPNPSIMLNLHELHALGIELAMDDFGTGYSSLSYLRRIPLSTLKLDKSFVHDMEHDTAAQALTRAVIRIGESLNLTVVAEGVENEAQRALLQIQGCEVGQGYLFTHPLPPEQLAEWLGSSAGGL